MKCPCLSPMKYASGRRSTLRNGGQHKLAACSRHAAGCVARGAVCATTDETLEPARLREQIFSDETLQLSRTILRPAEFSRILPKQGQPLCGAATNLAAAIKVFAADVTDLTVIASETMLPPLDFFDCLPINQPATPREATAHTQNTSGRASQASPHRTTNGSSSLKFPTRVKAGRAAAARRES